MPLPNSNYYKVYIKSSKIGIIEAWCPDEISFSVESAWDSPYSEVSRKIENFVSQFGYSIQNKYLLGQVWQGTSPIQISLNLRFYAKSASTAQKEVVDSIRDLNKMALPSLKKAQFLEPPGPFVVDAENSIAKGKVTYGGDRINIYIGKTLSFENVVIASVNNNLPLKLTKDAIPLTATVELVFRTYSILTKNELNNIFTSGSG